MLLRWLIILLTSHADLPGFKSGLAVKEAIVILANDGDNRHLRLNSKVERALLERQEIGERQVGAGAFGEHPQRHLYW